MRWRAWLSFSFLGMTTKGFATVNASFYHFLANALLELPDGGVAANTYLKPRAITVTMGDVILDLKVS